MGRGLRGLVGPLAALVLAALPVGFLLAGVVPVQVHLPIPQKIDVTGMRRLLVAGFRASDHPSRS
jgi:hypothetical protein